LPAAVIWPVKNLPKWCAASITALQAHIHHPMLRLVSWHASAGPSCLRNHTNILPVQKWGYSERPPTTAGVGCQHASLHTCNLQCWPWS
jgi:hypothetical protein